MNRFKVFIKSNGEKYTDEWFDMVDKLMESTDDMSDEEVDKAVSFLTDEDWAQLDQRSDESFNETMSNLGLTRGQLSDAARDVSDAEEGLNPEHRKLRDMVQRRKWLEIGNKPGTIETDEPSQEGGRFPRTEAVMEDLDMGTYASEFMGGHNLPQSEHPLSTGDMADMRTGWPKVQATTAQEFKDDPRLRNSAALNKGNKIDIFKMFGLKKASGTTDVSSENPGGGSRVELGGGKHRPSSEKEDVHNPSEGTDPVTEEEEDENGNGE